MKEEYWPWNLTDQELAAEIMEERLLRPGFLTITFLIEEGERRARLYNTKQEASRGGSWTCTAGSNEA